MHPDNCYPAMFLLLSLNWLPAEAVVFRKFSPGAIRPPETTGYPGLIFHKAISENYLVVPFFVFIFSIIFSENKTWLKSLERIAENLPSLVLNITLCAPNN